MKRILLFSFFTVLLTVPAISQSPLREYDATAVTIAQLATLVYRDTLGDPYVLEPEVLQDNRLISARFYDISDKTRWAQLLDSLGYFLEEREGVDYVFAKQKKDAPEDYDVFVYRPKFKRADDLKSSLSGLFSGRFGGDPSRLIYLGPKKEVVRLDKLLKQYDKKEQELVINGYIYEVSTTDNKTSSLSIVADVFKNAGIAVSNGTKLSNFLSFKNSDVDFYFSALSKDNRLKIISRPCLRVRSLKTAKLTVGRDVPTLGNVNYQDGTAVQSIEYRSSGVIFEITPEILRDAVNLEVRQEMSNFAETLNGVNNSPTLVKREMRTSITAKSGEVLVLGGLTEDKDSSSKAGLSFLPDFFATSSKTTERTEILLLLHIEVI